MPIRERYLCAAVGIVESELRLHDKRLTHPALLIPKAVSSSLSALYWKGTATELAELLCALDASGAIHSADGRKANFTDVVRNVEWLFNIRLGEPHDLKRNILRRKTRLTVFTDRLRRLLVEYSAKF